MNENEEGGKSMADNNKEESKKEPTNREIMDEVKRSHYLELGALFCSTAIVGLVLTLSSSSTKAQIYGWCLFAIGFGFFIYNFYKSKNRKKQG
jgi:hypothetical protein